MIMGTKSPSERFAGALDTYTIECIMGNGWALQSGTSHCLGIYMCVAPDLVCAVCVVVVRYNAVVLSLNDIDVVVGCFVRV